MSLVIYIGSEEGAEAASEAMGDVAEVCRVDASTDSVARALVDADALLDASMRVPITDEMLEAARKLKIISCATTGSDHIARDALSQKGIPVRTLREDPGLLKEITPAAELSWALLMACARKLKTAFRHTEQGFWSREEFPGIMLNGRTLGLVGCGRIGGWMAKYGQAFGMRVLAFDPYLDTYPEGVAERSLEHLVAESDFLSIHVHLSDETRGLISRDIVDACKPGLILINTSRGAIVDEAAVLDGLQSGKIGAVGVDVLDGEPETGDHPFVKYAGTHDNLLITPHCGGFSPDAVRLVCKHAAGKIRQELSKHG